MSKVSVESFHCLSTCVEFSRSTWIFANFTIGMIGNETGLLLNQLICGPQQKIRQQKWNLAHVEKRYMFCCFFAEKFVKKFDPVKGYDKTNMKNTGGA